MTSFDKYNLRFKFEIVDMNDDDVLVSDFTYIQVNDETLEVSTDSVEVHVFSALRHLPKFLADKERQAQEAEEDARRDREELEELEAEEAAAAAARRVDTPRFESLTDIRSKIEKILSEGKPGEGAG